MCRERPEGQLLLALGHGPDGHRLFVPGRGELVAFVRQPLDQPPLAQQGQHRPHLPCRHGRLLDQRAHVAGDTGVEHQQDAGLATAPAGTAAFGLVRLLVGPHGLGHQIVEIVFQTAVQTAGGMTGLAGFIDLRVWNGHAVGALVVEQR